MSDSQSSSSEEENRLDLENEGTEDEEDVEVAPEIVSLLDSKVFPNATVMLDYCKQQFGFDFLGTRSRLQLDFYGTVKLVNFVRQESKDGAKLPEVIQVDDFQDDRFLKPVLEDDALIMALDELPAYDKQSQSVDAPSHSFGSPDDRGHNAEMQKRNAELEGQVEALTKQFASYRQAVEQTLDKRWGDDVSDASSAPVLVRTGGKEKGSDLKEKDYYYESYAHNDIHETMLKDTVRTDAYRDFIYNNKHLFAGKVVLDVGCGTGILSMFCAKAGASQVLAVDASDIIDKARENVFRNGLDKIIRCLHGRMEEVVLPVEKVDIIVSEWMGYCLLYEAMLPSVLWARDRYLKPDGLLVPSHASLWIAPVSDTEYVAENVNFWRDVYGFDLVAMQANIHDNVRIQTMPPSSLAGDPHCFRLLDLYKISTNDLTFAVPWSSGRSSAAISADATDGHVDGFLIWFDIFFAASDKQASKVTPQISAQAWAGVGPDASIAFTTGPSGKETHWQQGLCLCQTPAVSRHVIHGQVEFAVPKDHERGLVIHISWQDESKPATAGNAEVLQSQSWQLR